MTEQETPNPVSQEQNNEESFWSSTVELLKFALIALPLVFIFRVYIAQPFVVNGASMEPTLHDKEYLIVYELPYHFRGPNRGDVVIFKYPNDTKQHFVKRVIALPGETIAIKDNVVTIFNEDNLDGLILEETHLQAPTHGDIRMTLSDEEYFVLGDNRNNSSDSRFWGPLNKKFIEGRAVLRLWPLNEISTNPGALEEIYHDDIDQ